MISVDEKCQRAGKSRVNRTYVNPHTHIVPEFRREKHSVLVEILNRSGFFGEALVSMA